MTTKPQPPAFHDGGLAAWASEAGAFDAPVGFADGAKVASALWTGRVVTLAVVNHGGHLGGGPPINESARRFKPLLRIKRWRASRKICSEMIGDVLPYQRIRDAAYALCDHLIGAWLHRNASREFAHAARLPTARY